jgi:hypothetical protein
MFTLRNSIFLPFLLFAFNLATSGQSNSAQVKSIKREFETINSDTTLKKVVLENEEFLGENIGDGGGKLVGFFKNHTVKKIYQWLGLSNGIEIKEYYFKDGKLIFIYEVFKSFEYDQIRNQMDYKKISTTFEGRYYFKNSKLIYEIVKGRNRRDGLLNPVEVLIEEAFNNLKLLKSKV